MNICTIVGMGEGISYSVAKRFAAEGYQIAMIARNASKLENLLQSLATSGYQAHAFEADAGNFQSLEKAFSDITSQLGNTDVLVYNVANLRQGTPSQLSADTLTNDFKMNVAGGLVAAQQVIPAMKQAKKGTILFTGGGLALHPFPGFASTAIGKAGIRHLAFMLHDELLASGIHVATVTVSGTVQPGTHFDPDTIAEKYWQLHKQEKGKFEKEIVFK